MRDICADNSEIASKDGVARYLFIGPRLRVSRTQVALERARRCAPTHHALALHELMELLLEVIQVRVALEDDQDRVVLGRDCGGSFKPSIP